MTTWTNTKLGESCDDGVLHVGLFEEDKPLWHVYLYPRRGVTLGTKDWAHRIAVLTIKGRTREYARKEALLAARRWLVENLDSLLETTK